MIIVKRNKGNTLAFKNPNKNFRTSEEIAINLLYTFRTGFQRRRFYWQYQPSGWTEIFKRR